MPSSAALTNVKLGVLLMTSAPEPFDLRRIGPALDIGLAYSENYYGIKYQVVYHNYTGFCPKHETVGYFSELFYNDHVQAVVGPACSESLVAVGRLAQYLKIPVVSGVGDLVVRKLADDDMFDTFTRMLYNLEKLSSKWCRKMYKIHNILRMQSFEISYVNVCQIETYGIPVSWNMLLMCARITCLKIFFF